MNAQSVASIPWAKRAPSLRSMFWARGTALDALLRVLLAAPLVVAVLVSVSPGIGMLRVQPELLALAAEAPDRVVGVIVQKFEDTRAPEAAVARLGGSVTMDLRIINGFAAELRAGAVSELALVDGVRWVSLDSAVTKSGGPADAISVARLANAYAGAIEATSLWNNPAYGYLQGQGVGVAVVDSGVSGNRSDISPRVAASAKFNSNTSSPQDQYGHGTHIAGTVGGNGSESAGAYIGVAPKVNLINVKVTDDLGRGSASDVINGLQWVLDNRALYNIRVVNISLNGSVAQSYHVDPLSAAAEVLWFNGIVVVTSAGNTGSGALYPPANDPFVITVGAVDDRGSADIGDDAVASFSAYGTTSDGFAKPDLAAPGVNIIASSAGNSATLVKDHPEAVVNNYYFRMSGTSMAAAVTSGAVALLVQDEPALNPDQIKFRLKATAKRGWGGYSAAAAGAGIVNAAAAVAGTTTETANTGTPVSNLLNSGSSPTGQAWGSVNWASVNWASVNWASVNWASVNWASVNWASDYWDTGTK